MDARMDGWMDGGTGAAGEGAALVLAAHGCGGTVSVLAFRGPGGVAGALHPGGRVAGYPEAWGWGDSSRVALPGGAQVGPLAGSFVVRAFSWLSLCSKTGVPSRFFPGSAHPFLLGRSHRRTVSPHGCLRCLKGEAAS